MQKLSFRDLILLGITNFMLYVGAGNIIFPPYLGLHTGTEVSLSALGFIITGVGLPVIAAIAMAAKAGVLTLITLPIGLRAGLIASVICYLCIGPLNAIPRTTTVSFEMGVFPFIESMDYLPIYSIIYFAIATLFALYPNKILDTLGRFLSPVKLIALLALCVAGVIFSPSLPISPVEPFKSEAFSLGIINGYLTLDTLASLAFGIVIVDAIHSRGVSDRKQVTKYAIISGSMAGIGFITIYACLFKLGVTANDIAPNAENGAVILRAFVNYAFGFMGNIFLCLLIVIACLVTAIGLICACSSYFSKITPIKYRTYVFIIAIFSCLISNLGLTQLIKVSTPLLMAVYPMFIVLVFASFISSKFKQVRFVVCPVAVLSLIFGINDGLRISGIELLPESLTSLIPLYKDNLGWLIPCFILFVILMIVDRVKNQPSNYQELSEEILRKETQDK